MNERVARLRRESFETPVTLDHERAAIVTQVYRERLGRLSAPMLRATALFELCRRQTLHIGDDELIVGDVPYREVAPNVEVMPSHLTPDQEAELRAVAMAADAATSLVVDLDGVLVLDDTAIGLIVGAAAGARRAELEVVQRNARHDLLGAALHILDRNIGKILLQEVSNLRRLFQ